MKLSDYELYKDEFITLYQGDTRKILPLMDPNSVQLVPTSPPYYGLRDYSAGDAEIGSEQTPREFIEVMLAVFEDVKKVIHPSGSVVLNLGDSYSSATPKLTDCLNGLLKDCLVFSFDTVALRPAAESIQIPTHDEWPPKTDLDPLLSPQREGVKDGHHNFTEVLDFFATPRDAGLPHASSRDVANATAPHVGMQIMDGVSVIMTHLDVQPEAEFIEPFTCLPIEDPNVPFAVEESGEPTTKSLVRWHSRRDTFSRAAILKGLPNIDLVNQPITLGNGVSPIASLFSDFRITKASEQQVTFQSITNNVALTVSDVRHLFFSLTDGSILPYFHYYKAAIREQNKRLAKQLLGIPAACNNALQEAGWYCRQSFAWVKRNPMPSSTTDRAGTATETMFHLAKRAKYFWDETAVRVQQTPDQAARVRNDRIGGATGHTVRHSEGGMYRQSPSNWNGSSFTKGKTAGHQKGTMQSEASRAARDRSNGNRNGEGGHLDDTPAGSRGFRNADLWFQSIEKPHGLVGVGDEITGIDCNPAGFSGDYCTACDRYYHDSKDKKAIRVEKDEDDKELRFCLCGRADKWLSHFATFPQALIAPFIKAGTSEYGQCVDCKAPYERIKEPTEAYAKYLGKGFHDHGGDLDEGMQQLRGKNGQNQMRDETGNTSADYRTIGWAKSCKCPTDEREPQTVLDIFGGAGTTAIAARRLGRKCILIELNPLYCKLIVARYQREFEEQDAVQASPAAESYAMPLFAKTNADTVDDNAI